ncbi:protein translocase component YidC [Atopobacter sp. AH10]|uniref:membrane protein insertase YidC n=1 Tax=Atopobacter sp. AH10 TaxID=2315861 RepID=UPI000EF1954A|nr:membrane protein insertase YidC [Atopobacter sp. AH10]RLK62851.1 protein translocase component YidC [Atopobacter sp. AH10]
MKHFSKKSFALIPLALLLTACGRGDITHESTGLWEGGIVYSFIRLIIWLSDICGGNYGVGIIVFTILVSILLMPLMHLQYKSMRKMTDLQPEVEEIKAKYPFGDRESQIKIQEETQALYKAKGVNTFAGCLPLLAQMPVLMAIYQAVFRSPVLRVGSFLWMNLGKPDPYFILPILAGVFTYISTWLSAKSQMQENGMTKAMQIVMPVMIALMAINLPSAVSLYWVTRNIFSVGQIMVLNNPYKIIEERQRQEKIKKDKARAVRKAWHRKKKK